MEQDAQLKQQLSDQQSLVTQCKTGMHHEIHTRRPVYHYLRSRAADATHNVVMDAELQAMQISLSLEEATQRIAALQPQVCMQRAAQLCPHMMLYPQSMLTSCSDHRAAPCSQAEAQQLEKQLGPDLKGGQGRC